MTTIRILVVDDERIIAKGLEKRLKGLGYAVVGLASTGEEAVQHAADLQPDLILMDISLGAGMDGIAAAALVRSRMCIPVVFLTAHSEDATLQRAKLSEPFGYVLKPYEDRDLQTAIEIGLYRHQMERRLRENEQWLAAVLGGIGDGVVATDPQGRVRLMNPLAEQLTGWSQVAALGRDVREVLQIVQEATRQPVKNPVFDALETGKPAHLAPGSILIDRMGVERPIDDSAAPIRDVNRVISGAVLVFRDITERRRLERQVDDHRRELEEANKRLDLLATTDGLTGLKNRRAYQERLVEEVKQAGRNSQPLSLLIVDVDHFKHFNDEFGHPAGDLALQGVARLLERNARSTDIVARYGGDELAMLLPDTDEPGAMMLAERIRLAVAEGEGRTPGITVSVGVATLGNPNASATDFVEKADAALYNSKRSGRNCVSHASECNIPDKGC